jgi:hypothetical protein
MNSEIENFINSVIGDVSELPDRTSPEDEPDMMLVTADELKTIILERLGEDSWFQKYVDANEALIDARRQLTDMETRLNSSGAARALAEAALARLSAHT